MSVETLGVCRWRKEDCATYQFAPGSLTSEIWLRNDCQREVVGSNPESFLLQLYLP